MACRFIEANHSIPPVSFGELLQQKLPEELAAEINGMLKIKAVSDEKALHPQMPVIRKYIEDEIVRYGQLSKSMEDDRTPDWETLDAAFLRCLMDTERKL